MLPPLDIAALAFLVVCWIGYSRLADSRAWEPRSLSAVMNLHRLRWLQAVVERDNRISDAALTGNLMRSISFFASSTILILGGLVALFGALDRVHDLLAELPLVAATGRQVNALKIGLLVLIFVRAFFAFTWSLRQFNYTCILIGGAPLPTADTAEKAAFVKRAARLHQLAGRSFNGGLRAYYFALATLCWFVHPWLFMAATALVVGVLYRREFKSKTLQTLT
jgi:uncharacterized membrane protein